MNFRHGDLALIGVGELPEGLIASKGKVLMVGSGGNDHAFDNGIFYPHEQGDNVIGYFQAEGNTKLLHPDHGKLIAGKKLRQVSIPAGIYELRWQNEETHEGMKQVID